MQRKLFSKCRILLFIMFCAGIYLPISTYAQCGLSISNSAGGNNPGGTLTVTSANNNIQRIRWYKDGILVGTQEATWGANATTIFSGNGSLTDKTQLVYPGVHGFKDTVYIADWNHRLWKWWPGLATPVIVIGVANATTAGAPPTGLNNPSCVYVDSENNVYVSEWSGKRANKWDRATGQLATRINIGKFLTTIFIVKDTVYATDWDTKCVWKYIPGASATANGISLVSGLDQPRVVFWYKDSMYVANKNGTILNKYVRGLTPAITVAGTGTSGAGLNQMGTVIGIHVDRLGNFYFAENDNHRITKWARGATSGVIVAGTGVAGTTATQLNGPQKVWISDHGYMYVSENIGMRVQQFAPTIVNTLASNVVGEYKAVTDGFDGCFDSVTLVIATVPPQPGNFLSFKGSVCKGDTGVIYNIDRVPVTNTYTWSYTPSTGVTITQLADTAIKISFASTAANGTLSVTAANAGGQSPARTANITVNDLPVVTMAPSGAQGVCQGDSLLLSANTSSTVNYEWKYGTTSVGTNSTYYAQQAGDYSVTVTDVTTSCMATATQTATLTINPLPNSAIVPAGPKKICQGDSVRLSSMLTTNDYDHTWQNNGVTVGGNDRMYMATTSGNYKVIMSNKITGCKDSSIVLSVTVYDIPSIILANNDTAVCEGNSVILYATTQDTAINYTWLKDGGLVSLATTDFLQVTTTGEYQVVVTMNNSPACADTTSVVVVTVNPLPTPVVLWDNKLLHAGSQYLSYQWNTGSNPIQGATDSTFKPGTNGGYSVTVTDSNGCSNTSAIKNINNVGASVGELNNSGEQVVVYPNPANSVVYIKSDKPVNALLLSVDGREVLSVDNVNAINIEHIADGTYLLLITDKSGLPVKREHLVKRSW